MLRIGEKKFTQDQPRTIPEKTWPTTYYLPHNENSLFWKIGHLHGVTKWELAVSYLEGMCEYLFKVVWRICGAVRDFFMMARCDQIKMRSKVFGYSLLSIGSSLIGIFCPVQAWKIDEWIFRDKDVQACRFLSDLNKKGWLQLVEHTSY